VSVLLEFRSVTRAFDDGARSRVIALDRTSFALEKGQCLRVTGPSGAGKSTLLSLACGLLAPTEGEVVFESEPFSRWRESFRAALRRRSMGVVVQHLALVHGMTAQENVALASIPDGLVSAERRAEHRALFAALGLEGLEDAKVETLSGGERQRVALVRALSVSSAKLLVLDEPSAHLDAARTEVLVRVLRERMADRGCAVLLATHDPRLDSLGRELALSPPRASEP
jgi:putative ABC transport system ATP-binding protein